LKLLKIILLILVISPLIFSLIGCSSNSVIKKATDGAVDVDKDGNIEIKDKDGIGEVKIGKAEWDKVKMHGLDAPKATLDSFVSSTDGTSYVFSEMKDKDLEAYIQKIKKAGFTYNYTSIDEFNYTGTNKEGLIISITYSQESKAGMITTMKGEKPIEGETGTIIEGENAEWDSSKVGGLPSPGVKITSFTSTEGSVSYTFEKLNNPKEYAEKVKEKGFTQEQSEVESSDGYFYSAKSSNGDGIFFTSSDDACSVVFTKSTP
jgi:hypothetical protein